MFYADFTARLLHDKEDPAVYLHSLRELLDKADPTLSAAAKDALLGRHFLTGLPTAMRLELLEHNPTPTLPEMVSFCKHLLAIDLAAGDAPSPPLCAAATSSESTPNVATPFSAIQDLTTAVKDLRIQQKAVVAALSTHSRPSSAGKDLASKIVAIPNPMVTGKCNLNPHNKQFNFKAIGVQDIREAMVNSKASKSFGSDEISSYF